MSGDSFLARQFYIYQLLSSHEQQTANHHPGSW